MNNTSHHLSVSLNFPISFTPNHQQSPPTPPLPRFLSPSSSHSQLGLSTTVQVLFLVFSLTHPTSSFFPLFSPFLSPPNTNLSSFFPYLLLYVLSADHTLIDRMWCANVFLHAHRLVVFFFLLSPFTDAQTHMCTHNTT